MAGIVAVIRTPSVGRLFLMNIVVYSSFSMIVGLWGGPYLTHIYGYTLEERGSLLLIPVRGADRRLAGLGADGSGVQGLQAAGADRRRRQRRLPRLSGGGRHAEPGALAVWFAIFGFLSAFGPLLVAHGRSLFPLPSRRARD